MSVSTKQLNDVNAFVDKLKNDLAYGRDVPPARVKHAERVIAAALGDPIADRYRVVALRIELLRGKSARSKKEEVEVLTLLNERVELAVLIANRAAALPDRHLVSARDK